MRLFVLVGGGGGEEKKKEEEKKEDQEAAEVEIRLMNIKPRARRYSAVEKTGRGRRRGEQRRREW